MGGCCVCAPGHRRPAVVWMPRWARFAVRMQTPPRCGGTAPPREDVALWLVSPSVGCKLTADRGTLWVRLPSLYDLRKIPTCFASLSQMARDARAIVFMVNACKGVSHGPGHERATFQSRVAARAGETTRKAIRIKV